MRGPSRNREWREGRREGQSGQRQLFAGAGARALRNAVETVRLDPRSDRAIDQASRTHGGPAGRRQARQALKTALVKAGGFGKKAADDAAKLRAHLRAGEKSVGIDACLAHPRQRQVYPPARCILTDVARDVGKLHRKAQFRSPFENVAIPPAHDQAHHHADGSGDAGGIIQYFVERFVTATGFVPFETLDQRVGDFVGDAVRPRDKRKGAVFQAVAGPPVIDGVEARSKRGSRPRTRRSLVNRIVG